MIESPGMVIHWSTHSFNNITRWSRRGSGWGWRERLWSNCNLLSLRINVLTFVKLALVHSCRYALASVLTRPIPHNILSLTSWSLILIRNTMITARTWWCYMPFPILQLSHYSPDVKSLPLALSSGKCSTMSNECEGDNVRKGWL